MTLADNIITATIYHIDGVKVGCTTNFKKRLIKNRKHYGDITMEIIETITASVREIADLEDYHSQRLGYGCISQEQRYDNPITLRVLFPTDEEREAMRSNCQNIKDDKWLAATRKKNQELWDDPKMRKRMSTQTAHGSTEGTRRGGNKRGNDPTWLTSRGSCQISINKRKSLSLGEFKRKRRKKQLGKDGFNTLLNNASTIHISGFYLLTSQESKNKTIRWFGNNWDKVQHISHEEMLSLAGERFV